MRIFRKMTEADIEAIARLEADTFSDAWTVKGITETFRGNQSMITVAEEDGCVIGYCILYYVLDEGEIARIAVEKGMRRKGVGDRLLAAAISDGEKMGLTHLFLEVRESNESARRFYEKHGFLKDGIRKGFYENPREEAVLMSREIP